MRRDPHHHRSPPRWRFSPPYMSTPPCTQYDFKPLRTDFSTDAPPTTSCGHATPRPNPWGWRSRIPPGTASGMTGGAMADATGSRTPATEPHIRTAWPRSCFVRRPLTAILGGVGLLLELSGALRTLTVPLSTAMSPASVMSVPVSSALDGRGRPAPWRPRG